jgi:transposase InsO family protein
MSSVSTGYLPNRLYPDERKASAVQFLKNTVAYFGSLGVRLRRVLTDNGSAFRSKAFAKACQRLGLKHSFTRAYRPQTNGKAERWHRPRQGIGGLAPISRLAQSRNNLLTLHS